MAVFENGQEVEKVPLSGLTDRKEMHALLTSKGFPLKKNVGGGEGETEEGDETTAATRRVRESKHNKHHKHHSRRNTNESEMERTTRKLILIVLATFIGMGCLVLRSGKNNGVHKRVDDNGGDATSNGGKSATASSAGGTATTATRRMVTATS